MPVLNASLIIRVSYLIRKPADLGRVNGFVKPW